MRNMSSPLTLETLLILACVRRDLDAERIQDLVKRGPDWHVILRGVERWSLAPLVYTSLRQADPTGQVPDHGRGAPSPPVSPPNDSLD